MPGTQKSDKPTNAERAVDASMHMQTGLPTDAKPES